MADLDVVEVVLKVTERCNINCDYCYMFNMGNDDYKRLPKRIPDSTVQALVSFISDASRTNNIGLVRFIFHGGEPMLLPKKHFRKVCQTLRSGVADKVRCEFGMQTNGTLVDPAWIDLFEELDLTPGVSMDGPPDLHDQHRIDFKGRGTYEQTIRGVNLLLDAASKKRIKAPGALCVVNPEHDGARVFSHCVDLGFQNVHFTLPITRLDDFTEAERLRLSRLLGGYLVGVLKAWILRKDTTIKVRILRRLMSLLSGGDEAARADLEYERTRVRLFSVDTDGTVGPDDSMKPLVDLNLWRWNVATARFDEIFNSEPFVTLDRESYATPDDCKPCAWNRVCRGGAFVGRIGNRYRARNAFNNANFYCEGLRDIFANVSAILMEAGLPYEKISSSLGLEHSLAARQREIPAETLPA